MDVKNTHSVTKTEISVFGRQALDAERRRSPSLADKVLMYTFVRICMCDSGLWAGSFPHGSAHNDSPQPELYLKMTVIHCMFTEVIK